MPNPRIALLLAVFSAFLTTITATAQTAQTGDKILAIVGRNRLILKSELEQEAAQMQQGNSAIEINDSLKCLLLQEMILRKMLVEQAERDSLLVSDEQVEGQLDNRVRYFIRQYGSKDKLEQLSGKTIYQMKEENREATRESLMADQMQSKIFENVRVTPGEVQSFYSKQSADSLPYYPATVEVGQIVMDPPTNQELDEYARKSLEDIRKDIITNGKSFETMAGLYSQDPGTRDNGGRMDGVTRDAVVPEFATATFRLQNGEVSPIVKTRFGYHIIQMVQRKGEQADVRHILIIPQHAAADYVKARERLDSVRTLLVTGKMTFAEAVSKYSTDEQTKLTAGMITNPNTGSSALEVSDLDPGLALGIDSLKPGSYSQPQLFKNQMGEQSARIVYLRSRTEPHKANLRDDYSKIQAVALAQKKQQKLDSWVTERLPSYYLRIDPAYGSCAPLQRWMAKTAAK
jgi:peptidyl-prolyl cis-trans isomerase SurA